MKAPADKTPENKTQSPAHESTQTQGGMEGLAQFADNRPATTQLQQLQAMANQSTQVGHISQLQSMADGPKSQEVVQKQKNNTGLPDKLKTGIENLSGIAMDDVKVHRNSNKPAQLNAHAYAQGSEIHLASGQEKHLPHEAWHVVQQKQGRVKPTMQMKGKVNINDDEGLEKEADVMGAKALQLKLDEQITNLPKSNENEVDTPILQNKPLTIKLKSEQTDGTAQLRGVVQMYDEDFMKVKSLVDSYSVHPYLVQNVNNQANFNQKLLSLKGYKALEAGDKLKVKSQVIMKIQHRTLNTVAPEDPDDIKKAFDSLKSCVITALLYAEGGTVLGTSTVEELHNILYVQFPKWRQYSDDGILAQMYQHFGYQTAQFGAKSRHSAVTDKDEARGMTSSTGDVGHMVGFRKVGQNYRFRDNDHGEGAMAGHATKDQMVNKIWWK